MILQVRKMIQRKCYDDGDIKLEASCFTYYDDCRLKCCTGGFDYSFFMMRFNTEDEVYTQLASALTTYKHLLFTNRAYLQSFTCPGVTVNMKNIVDKLKSNHPNNVAVSESCQVTLGEIYIAPIPTGLNRITVDMDDYYKDINVPYAGKWWGISSVTASGYAKIVMLDTPSRSGAKQSIDMAPMTQRVFTGNYKVFNISTDINAHTATIEIISPNGYVPTTVSDVTGDITANMVIKIPNKDGSYKSYPFNISIPGSGDGIGEDIIGDIIDDIITEPTALPKVVKVNTYLGSATLPNSYVGQEIEILGTVLNGPDKSENERAYLVVDGEVEEQGLTGNMPTLGAGFVGFTWQIPPGPSMRRVCIQVPKSDQYPNYSESQGCSLIMISPDTISVEDQLKIERGELKDRLDMIQSEREKMRRGYITAPDESKLSDTYEDIIRDIIGVDPIITPDPELPDELVIDEGAISIPSILTPPTAIELPTISIDGVVQGSPPLKVIVPTGKHQVKIDMKGFVPIYQTVLVGKDDNVILSGISFT